MFWQALYLEDMTCSFQGFFVGRDGIRLVLCVGVEDDVEICNLIVPNEMWQFRQQVILSVLVTQGENDMAANPWMKDSRNDNNNIRLFITLLVFVVPMPFQVERTDSFH